MRNAYIDNLRSFTVALVVVYHVIYMYNSILTAGVIGPIGETARLDALQYLLYPWFMLILFVVSGMCSRWYLQSHTEREYLRSRTRKLLVPSTVGVLVFGWAQGACNMAMSGALGMLREVPPPVAYLILCVSGTGVLWTIQVMWVLSVLLLLLRRVERGRLAAVGAKTGVPALLLLGIPVWAAAQVLNTPVIAVYRFGIYGAGFLLGYAVFSHEEVVERLSRRAAPLLAAALALGAVYTFVSYGQDYAQSPAVNSPLAIAYAWGMCLALLGAFYRWGGRSSRLTAFVAQKSFGLYVFHYLALSVTALLLTGYPSLPAPAVYLISAVMAFAGGLALYELVARVPVLRWCVLGISKRRKNHVS